MEFTVRRNSLLQALQHCRLAINKNNALPAFENFVLTFRNDCQLVLTVHTSDVAKELLNIYQQLKKLREE